MSIYQDITTIGVIGSKDNIIRMLNAAICNAGSGNVIKEDDSIDVINQKIKDKDNSCYGMEIGIPDLLEEECMYDPELLKKKHAYDKFMDDCLNCTRECQSDDCPWGRNPDDCPHNAGHFPNFRGVEIVRVEAGKDEYTAKFSLYEYEDGYYSDWVYWGDIARLYNCRIFLDDKLYLDGDFVKYDYTLYYEPIDGKVKETRFELKETDKDFDECYEQYFEKLVELCPERYLPVLEGFRNKKTTKFDKKQLMAGQQEASVQTKAATYSADCYDKEKDDDLPF